MSVFQEVYKGWSLYYFLDGMIPTYYGIKGAVQSANFTNIDVLKNWIDTQEVPTPPTNGTTPPNIQGLALIIAVVLFAVLLMGAMNQ